MELGDAYEDTQPSNLPGTSDRNQLAVVASAPQPAVSGPCKPSFKPCHPKRTDYNAPVMDQICRHVTITDRTHPFFGRTFPVIRETSSLGTAYLVVELPNGHTRSVPIAATDDVNGTSPPSTPGLLPISARTLLPVARHLQAIARAKEEVTHDISTDPQVPLSDSCDVDEESDTPHRDGSSRARSRSAPPVRPVSGGTHPTHSSSTPCPSPGGSTR